MTKPSWNSVARNGHHDQCHFISWRTGNIEVCLWSRVELVTSVYCSRWVIWTRCVVIEEKRLVNKTCGCEYLWHSYSIGLFFLQCVFDSDVHENCVPFSFTLNGCYWNRCWTSSDFIFKWSESHWGKQHIECMLLPSIIQYAGTIWKLSQNCFQCVHVQVVPSLWKYSVSEPIILLL